MLPRVAYREYDIFMLYTGGTTGLPKGVMYRHGHLAQALLFGFDLRGLARPATRQSPPAAADAVRVARGPSIHLVPTPLLPVPLLPGAALSPLTVLGPHCHLLALHLAPCLPSPPSHRY